MAPPGSGKSVVIAEIARLTTLRGNQVLFLVHRRELVQQIVHSFEENSVDMRYATVMTVGRAAHQLDKLKKPAVIITDETHHSLAKTYREIYDYFPDVPRLGFTATPWRMNGTGFEDIYDKMVEGPTVEWLIKHHSLAPYEYYMPQSVVNRDKLKRSHSGEYTKRSIDAELGKAIFGDVISNYRKLANGRQAILYAHSVEYSQMFANKFQKEGIAAEHIDAKTPTAERERIINGFRDKKITILCNVDLISEGFDVPEVGVIILLRPTKSLVLHVQQSMRGMRYRPGKTSIIIDQVANALEHGLPDTPHQWTLTGHKKETDPPLITCDFCYGTFHHWGRDADGKRVCPYCGKRPVVSVAQDSPNQGKDFVKDDLAKITDKAEFEKQRLARKSPYKERTLAGIFKVIDAKKDTGMGNNKFPIYRSMYIRLAQRDDIPPHEIVETAKLAGISTEKALMIYQGVLAKNKDQKRNEPHFSFNF